MSDATARRALELLLDRLASTHVSVSSVTEPGLAWEVHVSDSLCALDLEEVASAKKLADIGAGAGFPGLPLAVMLPECQVELIESVGRKCEFIEEAAAAAGIANAAAVNMRAEDWARERGFERYDLVTARAVGRLSELAELASPLLAEGGALVAWKGARDAAEEAELARTAPAVNMSIGRVVPVQPYPSSRNRHLHILTKEGGTPAGIPRRAGMARKRPLATRFCHGLSVSETDNP